MAFDFNSLSKTPISQKDVLSARTGATSSFSFDALPKSPIELAASKLYQYGSITPESVGLGPVAPKVPQTGWGLSVGPEKKPQMGTANTTPKVAEQIPTPKSYLEGLADIVNGAVTAERENVEKYKSGDIGAVERYTGSAANVTSVAVAPLMELFNQIPVVGGVMKVMGEGLTYGPKGAGEALSNVPGYKQILEKNPWITDYSEAVSPTVENATVTALNLATLLGTVESGIKTGIRGKAALEFRVTKDADGKLLTRNGEGDVVYIEDKNGVQTYGEKPADYPLIRLNSAIQDLKKSSGGAIENKKVTKNAETIKEIIIGTKTGQKWWAQNPESEAASQRVAGKVDLSDSVDTTGTVNTKPHQDYFRETYLAKKEDAGYKLLEKEDASVNIEQIINKLEEEFSNTNLPRSIVEKAISNAVKKVLTTADELGNIKLVELAKEKSAAQRSANYERTQNNSNAEIKNKTVGRALRLVVEDVSKTDVAKVNGELSKLYQELGILERLDGLKVSGGKLGKYFAQISGNIIGGLAGGAIGGPIGAAGAAVVGGELSSALRGKIMAGKFKKTIPSGEANTTLAKAMADAKKTTRVDLKTPDKKVGAPKSIKKTKEIVKLEGKIAKNVEAQRVAIKAKDYTLVAKLKQAYTILVEELKKAIKYLNENGSVGMSIKKTVTPESVAKRADEADMGVLDYVIRDYDNAILDPVTNRTLNDMGLGKATREERIAFAKEVFDEQAGVGGKVTVKKDLSAQPADASGDFGGYYHGSANVIDGELRPSEAGILGKGFYVTKDPKVAEDFAQTRNLPPEEQLDGLQKITDRSIKPNLYEVDTSKIKLKELGNADGLMDFLNGRSIDEARKELLAQGFDGIALSKRGESVVFPESMKKIKTTLKTPSNPTDPKNYKSAEEFVKAQGTPVYHGTKGSVDIKNISAQPESRGQYLGNGIYFTKYKEGAELYGGKILDAVVNEKDFLDISKLQGVNRTKEIGSFGTYKQYLKNNSLEDTTTNFKKWQKNQQEVADKILEMGYKGVTDGQQHVIFDKSTLKTKSQLTDIWNKANRTTSATGK